MSQGSGKERRKEEQREEEGNKWREEKGVMEAGEKEQRVGEKERGSREKRGKPSMTYMVSQPCPDIAMVDKVGNSFSESHTSNSSHSNNYRGDRCYVCVSKYCQSWLCDLSLEISEQKHCI